MSNNTNSNSSNPIKDENVTFSRLTETPGMYQYIKIPKNVYSECENIINTAVNLAFDPKQIETLKKEHKSDIDNMIDSKHDISLKLSICLAQKDKTKSNITHEAINTINKEYGIFNKQFHELKAKRQNEINKKIQDKRENNEKYYFSWFTDLGNNISNWWNNITQPYNTKKQEEKSPKEIELTQNPESKKQTSTPEELKQQLNVEIKDILTKRKNQSVDNTLSQLEDSMMETIRHTSNTTQPKPDDTPKTHGDASKQGNGQTL